MSHWPLPNSIAELVRSFVLQTLRGSLRARKAGSFKVKVCQDEDEDCYGR